jgi:hypothetical protein
VISTRSSAQGEGNFGFNAATGEYGDMIEMGILDPAKVTRTALQAAGSVAGLMITTEVMIAEAPGREARNARHGRHGRHGLLGSMSLSWGLRSEDLGLSALCFAECRHLSEMPPVAG